MMNWWTVGIATLLAALVGGGALVVQHTGEVQAVIEDTMPVTVINPNMNGAADMVLAIGQDIDADTEAYKAEQERLRQKSPELQELLNRLGK